MRSQPPRPYERKRRLDAIGRILADADDYDKYNHTSPQKQQYDSNTNNYSRTRTGGGAAMLGSQMHPLLTSSKQRRDYYKDKPIKYSQVEPIDQLLSTGRRILSLLLGHQAASDQDDKLVFQEEEILIRLLSSKSTIRTLRLFLLLPLLFYACKKYIPKWADEISKPSPWRWSAGVSLPGVYNAPPRNLAGRNCVMNYFIEKQPKDEYDPDYKEVKEGEIPKPVTLVEGTYRTEGQIHVISRFIEAVADSFRSNTSIRQHLIFTEVRDSGHLAHEAMKHWPPRGKHRTMVHVVAAQDSVDSNDVAAEALGYGHLEDIEVRFKGNDRAKIYDREGNLAGLVDEEGVDDDETLNEMMEMEVPDGETLELRRRSVKNNKKRGSSMVNSTVLSDGSMYPNLRLMLPFEEEDEDGEIVVPYLHVDGVSMTHQMQVLESARSLLEDKTIVIVGIEHSPGMDVRALIAFFKDVQYKTFFLGARQVARIDNLCEEVLNDVLDHPAVSPPKPSILRRLFINVGLVSGEELRIAPKSATDTVSINKKRETPPFFVAMPRGR